MTIASDNILDNIPANVENIAFTAKIYNRRYDVIIDIYDNGDGTFDVNGGEIGWPQGVKTFPELSYKDAREKLVELVTKYTFAHTITNVTFSTLN